MTIALRVSLILIISSKIKFQIIQQQQQQQKQPEKEQKKRIPLKIQFNNKQQ